MAHRSEQRFSLYLPTGRRRYWVDKNIWSDNSPRDPKGRLVLKSNPVHVDYRQILSFSEKYPGSGQNLPYNALHPLDVLSSREYGMPGIEAETYARLRGKLYKGGAALGVTLGSYKQSRDMVVNRYQQLDRRAAAMIASVGREAITVRGAASIHLEVIFGWVPLLQDIHNAVSTVCQLAPIYETVKSRGQAAGFLVRGDREISYHCKCTRATRYRADNPNLWLAERAGLLNPATTAWDLVPWSFVVNMFVNVNQLVQSISDFAGLHFEDQSITRTYRYTATERAWTWGSHGREVGATEVFRAFYKLREGDATQRPPVVFKLPDASWETAAMAASLFAQKFATISTMVKGAHTVIKTKTR